MSDNTRDDLLSFNVYTSHLDDYEKAQYTFLSKLNKSKQAFAENRLFPDLRRLVNVNRKVRQTLKRAKEIEESMTRAIKGVDFENWEVIFEEQPEELIDNEVESAKELMQWSRPFLLDVIEEGGTIGEFVENGMDIIEVEPLSPYRQEGYVLVADKTKGGSGVLRTYSYSLFVLEGAGGGQVRLKTTTVEDLALRAHPLPAPERINAALRERDDNFSNPATFLILPDVQFSYEWTTFPLARIKFTQHMRACGDI